MLQYVSSVAIMIAVVCSDGSVRPMPQHLCEIWLIPQWKFFLLWFGGCFIAVFVGVEPVKQSDSDLTEPGKPANLYVIKPFEAAIHFWLKRLTHPPFPADLRT